MPTNTEYGKAFEFACLSAIKMYVEGNQQVEVTLSAAFLTAQAAHGIISSEDRKSMASAADAAVKVLLMAEPKLADRINGCSLVLEIQPDAAGIGGDVRDVICIKEAANRWEIGISCKHNHYAIKHSRLSATINFGQEWFGVPCSPAYFNEIIPIFTELRNLQAQGVLWQHIPDKKERFYVPILEAFIRELVKLGTHNNNVPSAMVRYLLGNRDFYKFIADIQNRVTRILAFNFDGTLSQNNNSHKPIIKIPKLSLPTRFCEITFVPESDTTIQILCDSGWQISLRIHSASTVVEPSLKFDVTLTGIPPQIFSHYGQWA